MTDKKGMVTNNQDYFEHAGKSAKIVKAYVYDVGAFSSWFEQTTGDELVPGIVDPREITG